MNECIMCGTLTENIVKMSEAFFTGDYESKAMVDKPVCQCCMDNLNKVHG